MGDVSVFRQHRPYATAYREARLSSCGVKNARPLAEAKLTARVFAVFQNTCVSTIHGLAFQAHAMHFSSRGECDDAGWKGPGRGVR